MNDNDKNGWPRKPVFRPKRWGLILCLGLGAWVALWIVVGALLGLLGFLYEVLS